MFKIIARPEGPLVEIEVQERLTAQDFSDLTQKIGPLVDTYGKVRLLFDLSSLDRFEWNGLWEEDTFDEHDAIERVALVVPASQREQAECVFALGADRLRSFPPARRQLAWDWLTEGAAEQTADSELRLSNT
jgi:hypothetical protein